jgi:hypothetical protein
VKNLSFIQNHALYFESSHPPNVEHAIELRIFEPLAKYAHGHTKRMQKDWQRSRSQANCDALIQQYKQSCAPVSNPQHRFHLQIDLNDPSLSLADIKAESARLTQLLKSGHDCSEERKLYRDECIAPDQRDHGHDMYIHQLDRVIHKTKPKVAQLNEMIRDRGAVSHTSGLERPMMLRHHSSSSSNYHQLPRDDSDNSIHSDNDNVNDSDNDNDSDNVINIASATAASVASASASAPPTGGRQKKKAGRQEAKNRRRQSKREDAFLDHAVAGERNRICDDLLQLLTSREWKSMYGEPDPMRDRYMTEELLETSKYAYLWHTSFMQMDDVDQIEWLTRYQHTLINMLKETWTRMFGMNGVVYEAAIHKIRSVSGSFLALALKESSLTSEDLLFAKSCLSAAPMFREIVNKRVHEWYYSIMAHLRSNGVRLRDAVIRMDHNLNAFVISAPEHPKNIVTDVPAA